MASPFDKSTQLNADAMYKLRKNIFRAAMNREWDLVLDLYKKNQCIRDKKITSSDDTVLHVAISGATENKVLSLLDVIQKDEMDRVLGAQNISEDTPLHMAAALGLNRVCQKIASKRPDMVTKPRNKFHETPLFTAVRHGKKKTFFVLEAAIYDSAKERTENDLKAAGENSEKPSSQTENSWLHKRDISHCRRFDGNNILHYAVRGEHLDLAYEIIHLYPELVTYVNSKGESPLHTLANKPSVFKSGTRFGLYDSIIYYCTITEPLKLQFIDFKNKIDDKLKPKFNDDKYDNKLPMTCKACVDLFSLMMDYIKCIFKTAVSSFKTDISNKDNPDEENQSGGQTEESTRRFPPNYDIALFFFKIIIKLLLVVLGIGLRRLQTIRKLKQKHRNAFKIMKELVEQSNYWEYDDTKGGMKPDHLPSFMKQLGTTEPTEPGTEGKQMNQSEDEGSTILAGKEGDKDMLKKVLGKFSLEAKDDDMKDIIIIGMEKKESTTEPDTASPVLIAAKKGILEIVQIILENFPVAILDQDKDEKNIVLLAVEHRQVHVYKYILDSAPAMKEHVFGKVDREGNGAPHLAAMLSRNRPWSIPGAALQMQWEIKWHKYVLSSMDQEIFPTMNNKEKTAHEIFITNHEMLLKDGSKWLTNTSQSCSVVAALVATVAFASASQVPGGLNQNSGFPILGTKPAFDAFAIASLVALCFSVTSLVMFLAILTSRYEVRDFKSGLPVKLILGLTSLFISIIAMLVAFCSGDFFVVQEKLKFVAYPIYAVMCFPVTFFAIAQFPLYIDLIKATLTKVPEPTEKMQDFE